MEQRIKYNPKDYVDYLEESMRLFAEAMQGGDDSSWNTHGGACTTTRNRR